LNATKRVNKFTLAERLSRPTEESPYRILAVAWYRKMMRKKVLEGFKLNMRISEETRRKEQEL